MGNKQISCLSKDSFWTLLKEKLPTNKSFPLQQNNEMFVVWLDEILQTYPSDTSQQAIEDVLSERPLITLNLFQEAIEKQLNVKDTLFYFAVRQLEYQHNDKILTLLLLHLGLERLDKYDAIKTYLCNNPNASFNTFLAVVEEQYIEPGQVTTRQLRRILPDNTPFAGERPSDFEYAMMSQLAYATQEAQNHPRIYYAMGFAFSDWYRLGWRCDEFIVDEKTAYSGSVYLNKGSRQVVVAHRGTNPLVWGAVKADITEILGGIVGGQQQVSFTFVEDQLKRLAGQEKAVGLNFNQYQLSFTGHSLGAWLAGLSLPKFFATTHAWVVSFDSPGTFEMTDATEGLAGHNIVLPSQYAKWDILQYLTAPNLVNTCGRHFPEVRRVHLSIESKKDSVLGRLKQDCLYSLEQHGMIGILQSFDTNTGYILSDKQGLARRWPLIDWKDLGGIDAGKLLDGKDIVSNLMSGSEKLISGAGISGLFALTYNVFKAYNIIKNTTAAYRGFLSMTTREGGFHIDADSLEADKKFDLLYKHHYEVQADDQQYFNLQHCHPEFRTFLEDLLEYRAVLVQENSFANITNLVLFQMLSQFALLDDPIDKPIGRYFKIDGDLSAMVVRRRLMQCFSDGETGEQVQLFSTIKRYKEIPVSLDISKLWQAFHQLQVGPMPALASREYIELNLIESALIKAIHSRLCQQYLKHTMLKPHFLKHEVSIEDCYVHLQLVNPEATLPSDPASTELRFLATREVHLKNLFDQSRDRWISGHAGYGKTTLTKHIVHQWAKGGKNQLFPQFQWLLRIPLRSVISLKCKNIAEILNDVVFGAQCLKAAESDELWQCMQRNSDHILLILDGYDEVASLPSDHPAFKLLTDLYQSPFACLMTSRPCERGELGRAFDQELLLVGFSRQDIDRYVRMALPGEALVARRDTLLAHLSEDACLRDVARAPINLEMLCYLYRYADRMDDLSLLVEHRTGLYQRMLAQMLKQQLRKLGHSDAILRTIPWKVLLNMEHNHELVDALAIIAFNSRYLNTVLDNNVTLIRRKLIDDVLEKFEHISFDRLSQLGFVRTPEIQEGATLEDADAEFVHLSFHEFFAARFFVSELIESKTGFDAAAYLASNANHPNCLAILSFVAGVLAIDYPDRLEAFFAAITLNAEAPLERQILFLRCLSEARLPESQLARLAQLRIFYQAALTAKDKPILLRYREALLICPSIANHSSWVTLILNALKSSDAAEVTQMLHQLILLAPVMKLTSRESITPIILGMLEKQDLEQKAYAFSILLNMPLADTEKHRLYEQLLQSLADHNIRLHVNAAIKILRQEEATLLPELAKLGFKVLERKYASSKGSGDDLLATDRILQGLLALKDFEGFDQSLEAMYKKELPQYIVYPNMNIQRHIRDALISLQLSGAEWRVMERDWELSLEKAEFPVIERMHLYQLFFNRRIPCEGSNIMLFEEVRNWPLSAEPFEQLMSWHWLRQQLADVEQADFSLPFDPIDVDDLTSCNLTGQQLAMERVILTSAYPEDFQQVLLSAYPVLQPTFNDFYLNLVQARTPQMLASLIGSVAPYLKSREKSQRDTLKLIYARLVELLAVDEKEKLIPELLEKLRVAELLHQDSLIRSIVLLLLSMDHQFIEKFVTQIAENWTAAVDDLQKLPVIVVFGKIIKYDKKLGAALMQPDATLDLPDGFELCDSWSDDEDEDLDSKAPRPEKLELAASVWGAPKKENAAPSTQNPKTQQCAVFERPEMLAWLQPMFKQLVTLFSESDGKPIIRNAAKIALNAATHLLSNDQKKVVQLPLPVGAAAPPIVDQVADLAEIEVKLTQSSLSGLLTSIAKAQFDAIQTQLEANDLLEEKKIDLCCKYILLGMVCNDPFDVQKSEESLPGLFASTALKHLLRYMTHFQSAVAAPKPVPAFSQQATVIRFFQSRSLDNITSISKSGKCVQVTQVNQFLSHVALGEQDEAEAMLGQCPKLALFSGVLTDHAGRTFKDITGFQYALWALDWHMWEMILPHLNRANPNAASEQCRAQAKVTNRSGHEDNYNYREILTALKTYTDQFDGLYKANNFDALRRLWIPGVGGAQSRFPAHVAQEYCHPDRPFAPTPDFTKEAFSRQFKTDEGDWWSAQYNGGPLGGGGVDLKGFAVSRYSYNTALLLLGGLCDSCGSCVWAGPGWGESFGGTDHRSLGKLFEVRTSQLTETRSILLKSHHVPGAHS